MNTLIRWKEGFKLDGISTPWLWAHLLHHFPPLFTNLNTVLNASNLKYYFLPAATLNVHTNTTLNNPSHHY